MISNQIATLAVNSITNTRLKAAFETNNHRLLNKILNQTSFINTIESPQDVQFLLLASVAHVNVDVVKISLSHGANPKFIEPQTGVTPLVMAHINKAQGEEGATQAISDMRKVCVELLEGRF